MKIKHHMTCAALLAGSLAAAVITTNTAHADSASWTGAVDGTWSNVNNWAGPPAAVPGTGNDATFDGGSAGGVIDLGGGVTVTQIYFNASAPSLTLGAGAVNSQTLTLTGGDPLRGGGGSAGQTLTINAALTLAANSPRFIGISHPTVNINGDITTSRVGGTAMLRLNDSGITLNGVLSDGANALLGLQAQQNTYTLGNNSNTFTGGILLENATINVGSINMTGLASAAGAGGDIGFGNVFGYGGLNYTGTATTTDRTLYIAHGLNGGRITQSGTGHLKFTSDVTSIGLSGSATLHLQGSTAGTGELSGNISDHATIGSTNGRDAFASGATTMRLYSVAGIEIGAAVSGSPNIQPGTTVTAIDTATRTITLSQATTGNISQNTAITIDGVYNPTSVIKSGSGTWTLSGVNNTYSGETTVSAGTLFVTGTLSNSAVTVATTGTIGSNGGNGTLGNGLTIAAGGNLDLTGATLGANSTGILSLTGGSLTLGALTFEDLVGWDWENAAPGTYKLIDGAFSVDFGSTEFLSEASAYDFGNGRKGYFTQGSLNAVIIPEPSAVLLGGLGMLALLRRRRD